MPGLIVHWYAGSSSQPPANEFYFYQSSDGQWLFLHPLLMRILLAHYGAYQALPASIRGPLVEVEPQMQTPLLRKRHKFLGHMPLGGDPSLNITSFRHHCTAEGSLGGGRPHRGTRPPCGDSWSVDVVQGCMLWPRLI